MLFARFWSIITKNVLTRHEFYDIIKLREALQARLVRCKARLAIPTTMQAGAICSPPLVMMTWRMTTSATRPTSAIRPTARFLTARMNYNFGVGYDYYSSPITFAKWG